MSRLPLLVRLARIPWIAVLLLTWAAPGAAATLSRRPAGARTPAHGPTGTLACGPTVITESADNLITNGNSTSCNTGGITRANSYWRAFRLQTDFGITTAYHVCQVTIGVEAAVGGANGSQPITANLYTSSQSFPAGYPGSLTLIGTTSTTIPDQSDSLFTIPMDATAPVGSQLVVEIAIPDGLVDLNEFTIGSNADAETAPSYLSAPSCGLTAPTATADIPPPPGFPDMHIVMIVEGTASEGVALAVNTPQFDVGGNGVFELNELATVAPSWVNGSAASLAETGAAPDIVWIGGLVPSVVGTADYGTIASGATAQCTSCYQVQIDGTRTFGQHLDAMMQETITSTPSQLQDTLSKTWTIHIGNSFSDVDTDVVADPFYPFIETIFHKSVTAGCQDGTLFCPTDATTREQMAVFLLKAFLGAGYGPPDCVGLFSDVPCTPGAGFSDWIEDLYNRGITAGCQAQGDPLAYCPTRTVLRSEMAVFLLKTSQGSLYVPPACVGIFSDVTCTPGIGFPDWIEDIYNRGVTVGCQGPGNPLAYCPDQDILRQQMAVFLTRMFGLVLYGP